jgi:hypothetical protein
MRVLYFTAIPYPACRMALYCAFSVFLPRLAGALGLKNMRVLYFPSYQPYINLY